MRKKRSISVAPDLDAQIEKAALEAGVSYSAWLAEAARKEFAIRAGLEAVSQFEREHGAFSPAEMAEAEAWARAALGRGRGRSARPRKTA